MPSPQPASTDDESAIAKSAGSKQAKLDADPKLGPIDSPPATGTSCHHAAFPRGFGLTRAESAGVQFIEENGGGPAQL